MQAIYTTRHDFSLPLKRIEMSSVARTQRVLVGMIAGFILEEHQMVEVLDLTVPDAKSALLRATNPGTGVVLDYGTGGSNSVAANNALQAVISVESDRTWILKTRAWFKIDLPKVSVVLHDGNICPTKKCGISTSGDKAELRPNYALKIWDHKKFQHLELVLIDGRFRLSRMLTTLFRFTKPVCMLCDDCAPRACYHQIKALVGAREMTGRMAAFTFTPQTLPVAQMGWIIPAFANPA